MSYGNLTALSKKEDAVIPKKISLEQNYPNPFNPVTTIEYKTTTPSLVKLVVFNPLGQTVAILVNEFQKPGRYKVNFNANSLKSGSYFYRLSVKGKSLTKKMIILR
ncbi:MAG: T9SS type A sorting domain-containing protein [Nitrosopumilaceae archaeon]|nr:T9SS type A sorting domain-containing protein [Nitrosopumilaceae archaeon]NIU88337.1 T9SS type A sorting domain-containing protein [Nitrosopumilaceae archaeon]NIX62537.1 T9SS type A sorting domain-containing protein [Nitrosopumilaceae archaeon]